MTDFDRAVELALRTWYPKDHPLHFNPHHPLGKLLGEWGELLDDYMKSLYKPGYEFNPIDELGDIWYYIRILCYQRNFIPVVGEHRDIDTSLELSIAVIMNEVAFAFVGICTDIEPDNTFLDISCNLIQRICQRYNITLQQLTESNWQKLKPGSERGEQWAKARVQTSYIGGKVELKDA